MILKYLCHMRGKAVLEILVIILYLDVNLYYIAIDSYIYITRISLRNTQRYKYEGPTCMKLMYVTCHVYLHEAYVCVTCHAYLHEAYVCDLPCIPA